MDNTQYIFESQKCCIVIPTYNNQSTLASVIGEVMAYTSNIIVINDGSTDNTDEVLSQFPNIDILKNKTNRGKGYSLRKAFKYALEKGYDKAITIDSDGQHLAEDLPVFLEASANEPDALIIGARNMEVQNVPKKSSVGLRISNFWITVMTGIQLPDTQSGFRLYPIRKLAGTHYVSTRFEFEVEVIVKAVWKGIKIVSVPVKVFYAPENDRISHFRPFMDFTRISFLNVLLVTISIFTFWPKRAINRYRNLNFQQIIHDEIFMATGSNLKIALAIAFGIFMGIVPIWGYQLLVGFTLAHLLKLNKAIFFVAANISFPPLIPLILFASFYVGGLLLGKSGMLSFSIYNINFETVYVYLLQYLIGAVAFAILAGVTAFLISYFLLAWFRKEKFQ